MVFAIPAPVAGVSDFTGDSSRAFEVEVDVPRFRSYGDGDASNFLTDVSFS